MPIVSKTVDDVIEEMKQNLQDAITMAVAMRSDEMGGAPFNDVYDSFGVSRKERESIRARTPWKLDIKLLLSVAIKVGVRIDLRADTPDPVG